MIYNSRRSCRMTGCPNLAEHGKQYFAKHKQQAERFYSRPGVSRDLSAIRQADLNSCTGGASAHILVSVPALWMLLSGCFPCK